MPLMVSAKDAEKYGAKKDAAGNYVVGGSSKKTTPSADSSSNTPSKSASNATYTPSNSGTGELDKMLSGSQLSPDEQKAIRAVYDAVANNNEQEAQRLVANLKLGSAYADPILRQRVALITDELTRGFADVDNDLEYNETTLKNRLADLQQSITSNKGNLTLDEMAELRQMERAFQDQLTGVQDQLAASGFTNSSRRIKKERVMQETQGDLVESTKRSFAARQNQLDQQLTQGQRDTTLEVERLKELTARGKLDAARSAEAQLGSDRVGKLPELSGIKPLGGIGGEVDQQYYNDVSQFIF
jgi:hypothetical protein